MFSPKPDAILLPEVKLENSQIKNAAVDEVNSLMIVEEDGGGSNDTYHNFGLEFKANDTFLPSQVAHESSTVQTSTQATDAPLISTPQTGTPQLAI
jgi:hypothetical protein